MNPMTKSQTGRKVQAPVLRVTQTLQGKTLFEFLNFGHWNLFGFCDLLFGVYIVKPGCHKANPLWG
jgi:hypothetical protein